MEYIDVVIKIPEGDYQHIKNDWRKRRGSVPWSYIAWGTPLPKGHGRLIDADRLDECKEIMNTISGESKYAVMMDDIRNISTIIPADKEEEK